MVKFREATSTLIRAPRETVYGILASPERPSRHGGPHRVVHLVPNERVDVTPRTGARGTEAWFILRDAPGGTHVVHGAAYTPRNLLQTLRMRVHGEELREAVEDELHALKCLAESGAEPAHAP